MFLVELAKAFRCPRTYVLGALLAGVAVLPAVILATSQGSSGGPEFFDLIRRNGLFAALAAVVVIQPFILPLGAGLLSGESIAGEASGGTLRYLLVRPVSRVRLVLSKYGSVMALLAMAVGWVMLVGVATGGVAFGYGPLPTLSGTTIGAAAAAARIALAIAVISQILDGLSSLRVIHPYLLTHDWLAFADLFRSPVAWDAMRRGLLVFAAYTVLFLGAALTVMTRKDVTS